MAITVPFTSPMFDDAGNMTRTWILYFQSLGTATAAATAAAGSSTSGAVVANPTIIAAFAYRDQGALDVNVTYTAPVDVNFIGVHAYIEAPDYSGSNPVQKLDANALDTAIVAPRTRIDAGKFYTKNTPQDAAGEYVVVLTGLPVPAQAETWRVYLAPLGASYDPPVTPANNPSPTPSTLFFFDPTVSGSIGVEVAPLVTNVAVTLPIETRFSQSAWEYRVKITWLDPTAANNESTIQDFKEAGVALYPPASATVPALGIPGLTSFGYPERHAVAAGVQSWQSDWIQIPAVQQTWRVAVFSIGIRSNTYNQFITPQINFTTPLLDPTGVTTPGTVLADVTNWSVVSGYGYDTSGNFDLIFTPFFTLPTDPAWAYIAFVVNFPAGSTSFVNLGYPASGDGSYGDRAFPPRQAWPTTAQTWDFYAVSVDINGNSKYPTVGVTTAAQLGTSPKVSVAVLPQAIALGSGIEYAPLVTSPVGLGVAGNVIVYSLDVDGSEQFGFKFGWTAPVGDSRYQGLVPTVVYSGGGPVPLGIVGPDTTTVTTTSWPLNNGATGTLYFLSQDSAGRVNSIQPGITPGIGFTISVQTTGMLDLSRTNALKRSSHFNINGTGQLAIAPSAITTTELAALSVATGNLVNSVVTAAKLAPGAVADYTKFVSTLRPIEIVTSLPVSFTNYPAGSAVTLTSDFKLYRSTGSSWTTAVPGSDLVADSAFITKIQAVSITAVAVVSTWVYAGVINAGQITAGTVAVGISLSSPIITVTGSGFVINIDATNLIKVSGSTGTGQFSQMTAGTVTASASGSGPSCSMGGTTLNFSGSGFINMGGTQVLTVRQTGPGNTTDSTDVATRFNNLLSALRSHGLIT